MGKVIIAKVPTGLSSSEQLNAVLHNPRKPQTESPIVTVESSSANWNTVSNKPTEFPPSEHSHARIDGGNAGTIQDVMTVLSGGKSNSVHTFVLDGGHAVQPRIDGLINCGKAKNK